MIQDGIVSLRGAIDLHAHSGPSLFARVLDDIQYAQEAAAAGFEAIVIKNHFESTVGRAHLVAKQVPQIKVFGGLVLNTWTGGFNPAGVEAKILLGGKAIWMPTATAANHVRAFGSGTYTSGGKIMGPSPLRWSPRINPGEGLTVMDGSDLRKEVKEILKLAAEYDVILGSSHLSKQEIYTLIRYAKEVGVKKFVVNHPFWKLPGLSLDELKEFVEMGAYGELVTVCHITPDPVPIALAKEAVDCLGAERIIISSDFGAAMFAKPTEGIRLVAQWLYQLGVTEDQLKIMTTDLPKWLLGL